ncbi:TrmH family RNA methyltransferase [Rarobacter incanus]|uniref:TrmH family RNA methyltransferase n=1 Tax=Rarobacter incanus TaxID=153494 RepID=A0A542SLL1_9MICO|nr:RNA methyltransferase [Rarobacter incanus]TQK75521.1 TrmH family RNA methyltransferase [Rarobacter incanus]
MPTNHDRPEITNVNSDRVRAVRHLTSRSGRQRAGLFVVEGPQGVREAIAHAADRVRDVYITAEAAGRYPRMVADARAAAGVFVHAVSTQVANAMSADAQGVIAVADRAPYTPRQDALAELDGLARGGARMIAILHQVRDPGNAGAVIRAADAAGADAVVVTEHSVELTNPKVVRSTAGSLFHVPLVAGAPLEAAVDVLRAAGMSIFAADAAGERLDGPDFAWRLAAPTAWVFGNEARGFSDSERDLADRCVALPIFGAAESLNLATAAAVCLYASAFAQH